MISDVDMDLAPSNLSVPLKVAIACRKLARDGHCATLAGQISVRHDQETYWTAPLKEGYANVTQSTVIRVNNKMDVVEGNAIPNPGMQFHLWVYKSRPDVKAIVHTHPPFASALSMTGRRSPSRIWMHLSFMRTVATCRFGRVCPLLMKKAG